MSLRHTRDGVPPDAGAPRPLRHGLAPDRVTMIVDDPLAFETHQAFGRKVEISALSLTDGACLCIDLARVRRIDSAGLGMLLLARDTASRKGCATILAGADGQVLAMLSIARFDALFQLQARTR